MLVEMAIADAYSIPWEFIEDRIDSGVGPNDLSTYYHHPKHVVLGGGRYTDDTQRAIANAEVLLDGESDDFYEYAGRYFRGFERDPRPGYSRRHFEFLQEVRSSKEYVRNIRPFGHTNGAIMAAAVCGYENEPFKARLAAYTQASVTHGPSTFEWAAAIALSAHYFLHRVGPKAELFDFLNEYQPIQTNSHADWQGVVWLSPCDPASMAASDTTIAVLRHVMHRNTLSDILQEAVWAGGDTDTIAAVAVALGSSCDSIENNLPQALYDGLEDGEYGRAFLTDLDRKLAATYLHYG